MTRKVATYMAHRYYYNRNSNKNNKHEIHRQGCAYMPKEKNKMKIGLADDCHKAIIKAKERTGIEKFDGCAYCCSECNEA